MNQTPSWEEVKSLQGTRSSEIAPWESYDLEMSDPELHGQLAEAVQEYAKNYHDNTPSSEAQEELCRQQELAEEVSRDYQWVSPQEYKDHGARMGRILHSSEFIKLLRKAGVKCWYRSHPQKGKITLLVQRTGVLGLEIGAWVQSGWMPELSVFRFDEHNIPTTERLRGWRTAILQLILKSMIDEKTANKVFGKPKTTPQFNRYNATLQSFRNAGGSLEIK